MNFDARDSTVQVEEEDDPKSPFKHYTTNAKKVHKIKNKAVLMFFIE